MKIQNSSSMSFKNYHNVHVIWWLDDEHEVSRASYTSFLLLHNETYCEM